MITFWNCSLQLQYLNAHTLNLLSWQLKNLNISKVAVVITINWFNNPHLLKCSFPPCVLHSNHTTFLLQFLSHSSSPSNFNQPSHLQPPFNFNSHFPIHSQIPFSILRPFPRWALRNWKSRVGSVSTIAQLIWRIGDLEKDPRFIYYFNPNLVRACTVF